MPDEIKNHRLANIENILEERKAIIESSKILLKQLSDQVRNHDCLEWFLDFTHQTNWITDLRKVFWDRINNISDSEISANIYFFRDKTRNGIAYVLHPLLVAYNIDCFTDRIDQVIHGKSQRSAMFHSAYKKFGNQDGFLSRKFPHLALNEFRDLHYLLEPEIPEKWVWPIEYWSDDESKYLKTVVYKAINILKSPEYIQIAELSDKLENVLDWMRRFPDEQTFNLLDAWIKMTIKKYWARSLAKCLYFARKFNNSPYESVVDFAQTLENTIIDLTQLDEVKRILHIEDISDYVAKYLQFEGENRNEIVEDLR